MKKLHSGFILAFVLVLIFSTMGLTGTSSAASSAPEKIVVKGSHDLVLSAFRGAGQANPKTGELLSHKYTVITTCEHGDYGVNLPVEGNIEGGMLTYCIIKALGCSYPGGSYAGSMPADANGDRTLTLGELKPFADKLREEIKANFPGESTQVFQYSGDDGRVLFSR